MTPSLAPGRGTTGLGFLREEFRALPRDAVASRMDGRRPACFLSSGTDRSTVAGTIREVTGQTTHCHSIGFEADGYDEVARVPDCKVYTVQGAMPRVAAFTLALCADEPLRDVGTIQEALVALARQAVREDGADVIALAGAPLAGLMRQVTPLLPLPVVDGVSSAVVQAQALVALNPARAMAGNFAAPPSKPNAALSAAVAARLQPGGIQAR